jgi:septal ring factor EnvC (AmiA/AmiB activator)
MIQLKDKQSSLELLESAVEASIKTKTEKEVTRNSADIKLSWPVKKGLLVGTFGIHKHATERKVKVENNGIDVLVAENEKIVATQNGVIKAILEVPGSNTCIILDHGTYYSVYSNLKNVTHKVGSTVKEGDHIADIALNADGQSKLHFELWKETAKVNPEEYLQGSLK